MQVLVKLGLENRLNNYEQHFYELLFLLACIREEHFATMNGLLEETSYSDYALRSTVKVSAKSQFT